MGSDIPRRGESRRVRTTLTSGPVPLITNAGTGNLLKDIHSFVFCRQTIGEDEDGDPAITVDQHGAAAGAFFENRANRPSWHFAMNAEVTAVGSSASIVHVKHLAANGDYANGAVDIFATIYSSGGIVDVGDRGIVVGDSNNDPIFWPAKNRAVGPVVFQIASSHGTYSSTPFDHFYYRCHPVANGFSLLGDSSTNVIVHNLGTQRDILTNNSTPLVGGLVQFPGWYSEEHGFWFCVERGGIGLTFQAGVAVDSSDERYTLYADGGPAAGLIRVWSHDSNDTESTTVAI